MQPVSVPRDLARALVVLAASVLCFGVGAFAGGAGNPGVTTMATTNHWAFQPLADSPLPLVRNARWVRTEIDRFTLAHLEHGPSYDGPRLEVEPRTWIRRVTFDLT